MTDRPVPAPLGKTLLAAAAAFTAMSALAFGSVGPAMVAAPIGLAACAAPEPSPVAKRWELSFKPGPLRLMTLDVPGVGPKVFLYFTYTVTNNSGQDLLFAPMFELATPEGVLARSGREVPVGVTREIIDKLENPFLQDQINVLGMLLQGPENAKEGIVVWPADQLKVSEVTIFGSGFSGETAIEDFLDPSTGQTRKETLRKTAMLTYKIPGELMGRGAGALADPELRWIMR